MKPTIQTNVLPDNHTLYTDKSGDQLKVLTHGDDRPLFRINGARGSMHPNNVVLSRGQTKHLRRLLKQDHRDRLAHDASLGR